MKFTRTDLLNALQGEAAAPAPSRTDSTWGGTKDMATKAAAGIWGILPPTRNEVRKEVAQLELNDAQSVAVSRLIIERLEEYGIDLGITNDDVLEQTEEVLSGYYKHKEGEKKAKKLAKEAERAERVAAWKARFGAENVSPLVLNPNAEATGDDIFSPDPEISRLAVQKEAEAKKAAASGELAFGFDD